MPHSLAELSNIKYGVMTAGTGKKCPSARTPAYVVAPKSPFFWRRKYSKSTCSFSPQCVAAGGFRVLDALLAGGVELSGAVQHACVANDGNTPSGVARFQVIKLSVIINRTQGTRTQLTRRCRKEHAVSLQTTSAGGYDRPVGPVRNHFWFCIPGHPPGHQATFKHF